MTYKKLKEEVKDLDNLLIDPRRAINFISNISYVIGIIEDTYKSVKQVIDIDIIAIKRGDYKDIDEYLFKGDPEPIEYNTHSTSVYKLVNSAQEYIKILKSITFRFKDYVPKLDNLVEPLKNDKPPKDRLYTSHWLYGLELYEDYYKYNRKQIKRTIEYLYYLWLFKDGFPFYESVFRYYIKQYNKVKKEVSNGSKRAV